MGVGIASSLCLHSSTMFRIASSHMDAAHVARSFATPVGGRLSLPTNSTACLCQSTQHLLNTYKDTTSNTALILYSISMREPPSPPQSAIPPPSDRRQITIVRSGDATSQNVVLDEWFFGYYMKHPQQTQVLQESILLARRMVFTGAGVQTAAQVLLESWLSSQLQAPSADDTEGLLAKAIAEVERFEHFQTMTVIVDPALSQWTMVDCDETFKLRLRPTVSL